MLQLGQNPDEVDVAETRNQEWDAKKDQTELQTDRQKDPQLGLCEIFITNLFISFIFNRGSESWDIMVWCTIWGVFGAFWIGTNKGYDEHDAQVGDGENPEEDTGSDGVHGPPFEGVLDGERDTQVALNADGSEEEGTIVDSHVEDEAREGAEHIGHVPDHIVHYLLHLERQEKKKEEVRDGQIEEEDVDGGGFLPHFPTKSVKGEDVGRETQHKGHDIDRQAQSGVALLHGGLGQIQPVKRRRRVT